MKTQSYRKGWAFVLTLAMVFTTLFGGFGFLGINGIVDEVYADPIQRNTTLDLTIEGSADNLASEGWAWDNIGKILTLSGINLSTASPTGIQVPTGTSIVLEGINKIESTKGSGTVSYGINAVNGLTIGGTGTLTVTGGAVTDAGFANKSYGIYSGTGDITINSGTITATGGQSLGSGSYGIAVENDAIYINGGTVNALAGKGAVGEFSFGLDTGTQTLARSSLAEVM